MNATATQPPSGGQPPGAACPVCGTRCRGHAPPTISSESRGWSLAAHLAGLGIGVLTSAIFGFVGPLVVLLARKDDSYAEHHAKEALNFQLTVLFAIVVGLLLAVPVVIVGVLTLGIGLVVAAVALAAAAITWIVLPIIGAVKASSGEGYRYPVTIRFVR